MSSCRIYVRFLRALGKVARLKVSTAADQDDTFFFEKNSNLESNLHPQVGRFPWRTFFSSILHP